MAELDQETITRIEKILNETEADYRTMCDAGYYAIAVHSYWKVKGIVDILTIFGYTVEHDENNQCHVVPN